MMKERKVSKILCGLVVLSLSICMLSACSQTSGSAAPAADGGYTIDNIRNYVVGLDEKMVLENGKSIAVTNFDNAATTPALQPVSDEVNEQLKKYGLSDEEVHNFAECSDVNTPGMIRVSFGIYNTEEEVDYLLKVLPEAIKLAKKSDEAKLGLAEPLY